MPTVIYTKKYLTLFIILILGLCLRIFQLDRYGIWYDEKSSISTAVGIPRVGITTIGSKTWGDLGLHEKNTFSSKDFWQHNNLKEVIQASLHDNSSVVYFITLHYWINTFGTSDFAVRFLSVLFGCLLIVLIYFFSYNLFSSQRIALISAFLASVNPLFIEASQFTRSHMMATCFTLLSSYLFSLIIFHKKKNFMLPLSYCITIILSILSHYFSIYIIIGQSIAMVILVRGTEMWKKYLFANILAAFIVIFWLLSTGSEGLKVISTVNHSIRNTVATWHEGDNPYFMPATIKNILAGCTQGLLPIFGNYFQKFGFQLRIIIPFLIIPLCLLFCLANSTLFKNYKKQTFFLLILSLMFLPFATIMSVKSGYIVFFITNYSTYSSPYAMILLACAIDSISKMENTKWKKYFYSLAILQLIIMFISIYSLFQSPDLISRERNPFTETANTTIYTYYKGDTIIYSRWDDAQLVNLYLRKYPDFIQRIDSNLQDRILISKLNGNKKIIIDFKTINARY